ncbi:hypothetical protein SCUCBS95973_008617 [Sporothrix curviconia]|uniref:Uncharacterized protein n=1 Tax=Sporothrix curviconia TaxID=1260050 RepID=A0ABP0CQ59_9PEZI
MSAASTAPLAVPTSSGPASTGSGNGSLTNRTAVVILSSVVSVVGVVAVAGLVGISPINDDEIEAWKGNRGQPEVGESETKRSEPFGVYAGDNNGLESPPLLSAGVLGAGAIVQRRGSPVHAHNYPSKAASLDSPGISSKGESNTGSRPLPLRKKAPSNVIIYRDPPPPCPVMPNCAASDGGYHLFPGMAMAPDTAPRAAAATGCLYQQLQEQPQQVVPLYRRSEEFSPRSVQAMSFGYPASRGMAGRFSFDQDREVLFPYAPLASLQSPSTALQHARAPNSRAGLTDETVPGDPSFLPPPKRLPSRLLKMPPALGSPSATAAAATASVAAGGAGAYVVPRRSSHSVSGSSHFSSPAGIPIGINSSGDESNSAGADLWHARTRSARSCSKISYAGSEVALNRSFGQLPPQRRLSTMQYQPMVQPLVSMPPMLPQQSPMSAFHQQLPAPPLPVSLRPRLGSNGNENASRRSRRGIYHEYLHHGKQPQEVSSSSTLASLSSSSSALPQMGTAIAAAESSDDSDGPLLGGRLPQRPRMPERPRAIHERSSSLERLERIGRAIG